MDKGTLIIGGGVIGLSIGWKLLLRGEPVTLLEKGETGQESSWAAAGMLAPVGEVHFQEDQNLRLGMESMRRYPAFVEALESDSGMKVDYRTEGGLSVSLHPDDTAELRHRFEYQQALKLPVRWLRGGEAQEMEPALSPSVVAAVYSPDDHQVDNRKLVEALKAAFLKAGGALHEQTPVERLVLHENGAPSVLAGNREWRHQRLLLTAGSWSGMIPGLDGALRPWGRHVKGQILAIPAGRATRRTKIRTAAAYIAPSLDCLVSVGGTVGDRGCARPLTLVGWLAVVRGAWRAIPAVYEMPLAETWCGFRPGSRDNAPIIGETEIPAFFIATGHYRNGILNTPVTAEVMSEIVLGAQPPEFLAPFSPLRFHE